MRLNEYNNIHENVWNDYDSMGYRDGEEKDLKKLISDFFNALQDQK